jgi:DNA-binding TFAR19-related protein (PDSD5 family)
VAIPASPLRYVGDVLLGLAQMYRAIETQAWAFLDYLMEMNSTRVQSDIVNRVQESRGQLEVEIRKLLHEVTRIAEHALDRARKAKTEGASAVEAALARLDRIGRSVRSLTDVSGIDEPTNGTIGIVGHGVQH